MSDDEADPELLELLRQSLGISSNLPRDEISRETGILRDAEYICTHAIDVSINMYGAQAAAASISASMRARKYSNQTWATHPLHPTLSQGFSELDIVNFVFTMDLLNFSFWSEKSEADRFQVEYRNQCWTGYNSLVACLRKALDQGIPITTPLFWNDRACTDDLLEHVFRSATEESMPLLQERIFILREAGEILQEKFGGDTEDEGFLNVHPGEFFAFRDSEACQLPAAICVEHAELSTIDARVPQIGLGGVVDGLSQCITSHSGLNGKTATDDENTEAEEVSSLPTPPFDGGPKKRILLDTRIVRMVEMADSSAGKLVNLLARDFPCFRDETCFEGERVRLLKRAQIFVADLWAAFQGAGPGKFDDIHNLTMFADYRVPQILHAMGVLNYSPPLERRIRMQQEIESGHSWEVQLRGCGIWAVELMRREMVIKRAQVDEAKEINAVLIDFFLYDLVKEQEARGKFMPFLFPHMGDAVARNRRNRYHMRRALQSHTRQQRLERIERR